MFASSGNRKRDEPWASRSTQANTPFGRCANKDVDLDTPQVLARMFSELITYLHVSFNLIHPLPQIVRNGSGGPSPSSSTFLAIGIAKLKALFGTPLLNACRSS